MPPTCPRLDIVDHTTLAKYVAMEANGSVIKMHRDRNVWTIDTYVNEDMDFSRPE